MYIFLSSASRPFPKPSDALLETKANIVDCKSEDDKWNRNGKANAEGVLCHV